MKRLLLLFLLLATAGFSQDNEIPMMDDKVAYSKVIDVPGEDTTELKARAIYYFSIAENVEESESGNALVYSKASDDFNAGKKTAISGQKLQIAMNYTLKIELKDGRYRVVVTNIEFRPHPTPDRPTPLATSAEDMRKGYLENKGRRNSRASKQYAFFANAERIFNERVEEIEEVMKRTVPQQTDDW